MRQKLAVCCAYLYSPSVILLDEPLTGLDPPAIRTLLDSVSVRAAAGATIIISSHLLAMIAPVCSHLLVMQNGSGQYFGDTKTLRDQFPHAKTLEDAYFAATHPTAPTHAPTGSPLIHTTVLPQLEKEDSSPATSHGVTEAVS